MNWGSLAEFLAMGGYGGFVWGSFGVTALIFVVEIILLVRRRRSALCQLPAVSRAKQ
jgi:heme exporter protein D